MRALAAEAERRDGYSPFGDDLWRTLEADRPGLAVLFAHERPPQDGNGETEPAGALVLDADASMRARAALVVRPSRRGTGVEAHLLEAARADASSRGARRLQLWVLGVDDQTPVLDPLTPERELWQMRVPLPFAEVPRWGPGIEVRSFEIGRDEDAWLEVNNRAFGAHPEQGRWDLATIRARETEDWFDPTGLLLAFDADGLAGSIWMRMHPPAPPHEPHTRGEVYVLAVDPGRQGQGLGHALLLAGLDHGYRRGAPVGMLYVDAANAPATALYRSLGFVVSRVDALYGCPLETPLDSRGGTT